MTEKRNGRLALVGVGRMGASMAAGWLRKARGGVPAEDLVFVEPELQGPAADLAREHGVQHATEFDAELAKEVDTLILAVKPQVMEKILPQISEVVGEDTLIISVAAGISLRTFERAFPGRPIVRNMPNVPGAIGKGINVAIANERADALDLREGDRVVVTIEAGDLTALRAGQNTWSTLVEVAERAASVGEPPAAADADRDPDPDRV